MAKMTGSHWFFRFAGPCSEFRRATNRMSMKAYIQAIKMIRENSDPGKDFLIANYPDATRDYLASNGDWTEDSVLRFWYQHRRRPGRPPECDVTRSVIKTIHGPEVWVAGRDGSQRLINAFGLDLAVGNLVYSHWNIIAKVG